MRRGDIVTVAFQGDFGKPRPALIIQLDIFNETHATITVLLMSSEIVDAPLFRITVVPTPENNLERGSQMQVDKIMTIRRDRIGAVIGRIDDETLVWGKPRLGGLDWNRMRVSTRYSPPARFLAPVQITHEPIVGVYVTFNF
jgi:mRNA interferase MazF